MLGDDKGGLSLSDGYPGVAAFIARDPDSETYIFRKFKVLTARIMLSLQSELIDLEYRLAILDQEAAFSLDPDLRRSLRNWEHLHDCAAVSAAKLERVQILHNIEVKLCKYHKMLLLESEVARMDEPSERVLEGYQTDFKGGAKGTQFKLGGRSEGILDEREDLVALKRSQSKDLVSTLLLKHWPFPTSDLSDAVARGKTASARYFRESTLQRIVNIINTIFAGALLIGSILTLYFVTGPRLRLGLVIMFMVLFATGLGLTTNASRDSMFAATAAYAAVLVVFISGNLGQGNG